MEKNKSNYVVVRERYLTNLEREVSVLMEDGYVPHGVLLIEYEEHSKVTFYIQPMILNEKIGVDNTKNFQTKELNNFPDPNGSEGETIFKKNEFIP